MIFAVQTSDLRFAEQFFANIVWQIFLKVLYKKGSEFVTGYPSLFTTLEICTSILTKSKTEEMLKFTCLLLVSYIVLIDTSFGCSHCPGPRRRQINNLDPGLKIQIFERKSIYNLIFLLQLLLHWKSKLSLFAKKTDNLD